MQSPLRSELPQAEIPRPLPCVSSPRRTRFTGLRRGLLTPCGTGMARPAGCCRPPCPASFDVQFLLHVVQVDGQYPAHALLLRRRKVRFARNSRRRKFLARSLASPLPGEPVSLGFAGVCSHPAAQVWPVPLGVAARRARRHLMCNSFSTSFRLMVSIRLTPCSCMVTP